jgi:hypothetical protein
MCTDRARLFSAQCRKVEFDVVIFEMNRKKNCGVLESTPQTRMGMRGVRGVQSLYVEGKSTDNPCLHPPGGNKTKNPDQIRGKSLIGLSLFGIRYPAAYKPNREVRCGLRSLIWPVSQVNNFYSNPDKSGCLFLCQRTDTGKLANESVFVS